MSTDTYKHSKVFSSLKQITESLQGNLTTSQYLQVYDEYLERAILPIVLSTKLFDSYLIRLVGWQEKNFRRKVSFLERSNFPALAFTFLLQPDEASRIKAYKALSLDRGVRTEFIKLFLSKLEVYLKACNCELTSPDNPKIQDLSYCLRAKTLIESELRSTKPLITVYEEVKFWHAHSSNFKKIILEKYVRMCLNEAQKDYVSFFECKISLDDIIQTYLIAASRAIDKCDSKQGALTSHIKNWLLTGRTRVAEQLKRSEDVKLHSDDLDSDGVEFQISTESAQNSSIQDDLQEKLVTIQYLAKLVDPIGVARAYLNLE
jgi:hypothetical protein